MVYLSPDFLLNFTLEKEKMNEEIVKTKRLLAESDDRLRDQKAFVTKVISEKNKALDKSAAHIDSSRRMEMLMKVKGI